MEEDKNYSCDRKCPQFILYKDSVKKTILKAGLLKYCAIDVTNPYVAELINELVEEIFDNLI